MEFQPSPLPSPASSAEGVTTDSASASASARAAGSAPSHRAAADRAAAGGNGKVASAGFSSVFDEESPDEEAPEDEPLNQPLNQPPRPGGSNLAAPVKPDPTKIDAANFDALFVQWKASGDPQIRERLILSQRSMVIYLARRFMDRGEMFEDVMQIGMVGLINALDGFDHTRGIRFSTFAIPSISGEIRRYFRDKVWGMRVPRRMQELYSQIQNRIDDLTQKLDRSPTYAEIATELGVEVEEVVETMEMGSALDPQSLDDTVYGEEGTSVADTIGGLDPDLVAYEEHASLQMALSRLTEKERRVLEMAYFDGYSQADIARQMGVSQMHISRLLRRSLTQLRHLLEEF